MLDKIDIIITTKNRVSDLIFTINHMISIGFIQSQFYIIDDGSTDNTYEIIKAKFPNILLEKNDEPKGYMFNRSKMMSNTKRDFILSLDDDSHIRYREDVEKAIDILQSNSNYGIFHFHVFNQLDDPTPKTRLTNEIYKVKSYIGCGHIIKREVIQKVGTYFNELEFYEEEMNFSLRAFKAGYYVVTNESLVVHHRIDQKARSLQKHNINDKGVYGYYWRKKMHSSNRLIIPLINYPYGIDVYYFIKIFSGIFYQSTFIDKKINLVFVSLKRVVSLRKEILNNIDKLSYNQFKEWNNLPHYPSSGN